MSILNRTYSSGGAGRVIGTAYQNTSAVYPLIVNVHCQSTAGWSNPTTAVIGPTSTPATVVWSENPNNVAAEIDDTYFFFVPPLYYYKATGGTLVWWEEYQILTGTLTDSGDLGPSGANTRALSTTYTNSGTNGITVIAILTGIATAVTASGTSNGGNNYLVDSEGAISYAIQTVKLFVPGGATYSIVCSGATIQSWHEYDIGCSFTDPGDQSVNLAIGHTAQNTSTSPWIVQVPASFTSAGSTGGIGIVTDSSNPPTTRQSAQWKRSNSGGPKCTATGIVMPEEYVTPTFEKAVGGSLASVGSPRLYSLGGIPFASAPILTYQNP